MIKKEKITNVKCVSTSLVGIFRQEPPYKRGNYCQVMGDELTYPIRLLNMWAENVECFTEFELVYANGAGFVVKSSVPEGYTIDYICDTGCGQYELWPTEEEFNELSRLFKEDLLT